MPQNVPPFEWTENALQLRQFVFEYWCAHGRAPNLRNCHEALGLNRREIQAAYKELQLGIVVVVNQDSQNVDLLKAPPFSAFPSQVEMFIDDQFHSYVGCGSEAIAVSNMPPFRNKDVRLESYCACCFEPITLVSRNFEVQSISHATTRLHISLNPYDWGNVDMGSMCDSMNYVIDTAHADRYERQIGRRGIMLDIDQAKQFVSGVASARMWDYHWPPGRMTPQGIIDGFAALGADVSNWIDRGDPRNQPASTPT